MPTNNVPRCSRCGETYQRCTDDFDCRCNREARPNLARVLAAGQAFFELGAVVGLAGDYIEVRLGSADDLDAVERYLTANPTPDTW